MQSLQHDEWVVGFYPGLLETVEKSPIYGKVVFLKLDDSHGDLGALKYSRPSAFA